MLTRVWSAVIVAALVLIPTVLAGQGPVVELTSPGTNISTQFTQVAVIWCGTGSFSATRNGEITTFTKTQGGTCSGIPPSPPVGAGTLFKPGADRKPLRAVTPPQSYLWSASKTYNEDSPLPLGDNVFAFNACDNSGCTTTTFTIRVSNVVPPQITVVAPSGDGVHVTVPLLRVDYAGGTINLSKFKATVDGVDRSASYSKTSTSATWQSPALGAGFHTVQYRVCNTSACSDASQQFVTEATIETAWEPEDIIPIPEGVAPEIVLVPGAQAVPQSTGCPAVAGNPWVWTDNPRYEWSHWHPVGHVFKGAILRNKTDIHFSILWLKPSPQSAYYHNNCPTWITSANYSWSDFSETPQDANPYGAPPPLIARPLSLASPFSSLRSPSRAKTLVNPFRPRTKGGRPPDPRDQPQRLPVGDPVSPAQVDVILNGTTIIQGGVAVPGVGVKNLVFNAPTGLQFDLAPGDPLLNRYNKLNPPPHRGWNTMLFRAEATWSTTRFVVDNDFGPALSPQVDFSVHAWDNQEQGGCAALGDFQCAGLVVAQGIPGYVTRDKARNLDLAYVSGRGGAPLIVPFDLLVPEAQRVPETITLKPVDAGGVVTIGDAKSYIGKKGTNANVDQTYLMMENRNERRAAAVVVQPQYLPTTPGLFRVGANVSSTFLLDNGNPGAAVDNTFIDIPFAPITAGPFGRGWALAELTQLYFVGSPTATDKVMLVRGDGSIKIFTKSGTAYVAPAGEFTRLRAVTAEDGAAFVQSFQDGGRIGFDATGRQVWTADLIGNKTRFVWATSGPLAGKLTQITDPASSGAFGFSFDYVGDRVTQINALGIASTRPIARLYYTGVQLDSLAVYSSATERSVTRYLYDATTTLLTTVREPRWNLGPEFNQFQTDFVYRLSGLPYSRKLPVYRGVRATAFERLPWHRRLPRSGTGNLGNEERLLFHTQVEGRFVDPMGHDLLYRADRFGGLTYIRKTITRLAGGSMCGLLGMPLCQPNDDETIIERDVNGLPTKVVHQRMLTIGNGTAQWIGYGDSVRIDYDALGNPRHVTRPKGRMDIGQPEVQLTRELTYAYVDQYPRWCTVLTQSKDVLGRATQVAYGLRDPCLADNVTGIAGDVTRFEYGTLASGNPAGVRPISVKNALDQVVRFEYDPVTWNRNKTTSPSGLSVTTVLFDAFGRPETTIDPESHPTNVVLDWIGRTTHVTVGSDDPITPGYDDRQVVDQGYDAAGNNTRTTVQNRRADNTVESQLTERFFNGLGLVDSIRAPNGEVERTWYAHDGVVAGTQGRNGSWVYFAYDPLHRVTRKQLTQPNYLVNAFADQDTRNHHIPGGFAHMGGEFRYHYNAAGQQDSVIELGGSVIGRTVYSDGSFRTENQCPRSTVCVNLSYQYNELGQRTQLDYTHASLGSGSLSYTYNATTGRLETLVGKYADPGGAMQTVVDALYAYDILGRPRQETERISGLSTELDYQIDGYQTLHRVRRAGGAVDYSWSASSFDKVGNLKTYNSDERGFLQQHQLGYSQDGLYRLTFDLFGGGNHYEYDVAGNRTRADTSTYAYDVANRLLTRTKINQSLRDRYYHDRSGNRLSEWAIEVDGEWQREFMTYDAENRLYGLAKIHHWFVNSWALSWTTYDGLGRRVYTHENLDVIPDRSKTDANAGGSRQYYIWDGDDVLLRFEGVSGSMILKARYYPGPGVDGNIAGTLNNNGQVKTWYFIRDRQGSTKWLRDATGELETNGLVWQYDPFGQATPNLQGTNKDNAGSEVGYAGASVGTGSGYIYLRNRYYDPSTGRFLTEDPIGFAGGINFYAYADNNPIAFTDPFGLCPPPPGTFDPLCVAVNLSAGFGDAVTFGLTAKLRGDADDQVDKSSAVYTAGQVAGVAASAALGGAVAKTIQQGGVLATSAPARAAAGGLVRVGGRLLGTAGRLNRGGAFRIGVAKLGGGTGRAVLRVAGSWVKAVTGVDHVYLADLGALAKWF